MRYLDPKADLTFKHVFGEHPDLVISLLNALLPLNPRHEIREIEYLPAELVPENPLRKNSIVDVRCRDAEGRQFIVEMLRRPMYGKSTPVRNTNCCSRYIR